MPTELFSSTILRLNAAWDKKWVIPAPAFRRIQLSSIRNLAYKENQAFKDCWQITVHEQDLAAVLLLGSVFYQIFPDRFARDRL